MGDTLLYDVTAYGGRFFAATPLGLRVSEDGLAWSAGSQKGMSSWSPRAMAASGDNVLALTERDLFYSADLGARWRMVPRVDANLKWLAAGNGRFFAGSESSVWASADSAKSWKRIYPTLKFPGDSLLGMTAGSDGIYLATRKNGILRETGSETDWTRRLGIPGQAEEYCNLSQADGSLYLSNPGGSFVGSWAGVGWSPVEFPGHGPHDFQAGDGQGLAVSSAQGIFLRASSGSDWQAAEAGLPRDTLALLALNEGRIFAGFFPQGIWLGTGFPVAVRAAGSKPVLLAEPEIFPGPAGVTVFRLLFARPGRIRLTLHGATGKTLASIERMTQPGLVDVSARPREGGVAFYRLTVESAEGTGTGLIRRGMAPAAY
jgi:hypothetical protein